ncbi:MAG TPA: hypothetical protein VLL72_04080 [Kiloniellales bacterium]|nr:hypothetical protein [Kiloniellales bacterium]
MYTQVSSKLAVAASGTEYSQAVSMAGGNAIAVEATIFSGTMTVKYQESNDLQNWTAAADLSPAISGSAGAYYGDATGIAAQYVRLQYDASAAGVVAAGINVAKL